MIRLFTYIFSYIFLGSAILSSGNSDTEIRTRIFKIENEDVRVTNEVEDMFYGLYQGAKSGYLLLNRDGTGEYKYDIFGVVSTHCREGVIKFEWGCPLGKNNNKVKFRKPYGYSYPVILKCSEEICFQGCSKDYILDFILDKNDGKLHVSSSDDWVKSK
jgi:hypothetical protein